MAGAAVLAACRGASTTAPGVPVLQEARLFAASDGRRVTEAELLTAMLASDVVLIGEQHGHPLGLDLAARLFERLVADPKGASAALCLEFFTRDQQAAIDAFLRGTSSEAEFRKAAELKDEGAYPAGHRRMVEAAKARGRPVIAANAPRALVKRARLEGFEKLRAEPNEQVVVPEALTEGKYRDDFMALMGGGHAGVDVATMEGFYRAQNVWDATMAGSVVQALATSRPVVQVVGGFHVDGAGGLYQRVRAAAPEAKLWRLSMVAEAPDGLRAEDKQRADVVAYVGAAKA
jgi:uncharacterized iron-regulated protein